ncbi:hypothetical protein E6C67_14760 [Azospirillum sp. TSA2s]|uniref:hypothetical protein n=1 Tax=Azospirillum sp. TSA2s TaxID=709810 RepID=UPI0010AA8A3C|nr:hypothetical protein [Azospirillum sp. TSA2s]QCG95160.1 hypothetical protein E6C67_14760 [Azospirillum sp. TSA2s]
MGWSQVKPKVIQALKDGTFQHEARREIATKNLLQMGDVTADEIAQVLRTARGTDHRTDPHHNDPGIDVNIVTHKGWYIKFYFADPDTIFISVHK